MLKAVCICLLGALVASPSAVADEGVTVGAFVGAHVFSPTIELGVVDSRTSDSPSNSIAFGVRAGYQLFRSLAVEGELGVMPGQTRASRDDLTVFGWRTQAVIDLLPEDRLRPFALVGLGFLTVSPSNTSALDEDTDLAGHIGLGLEYDLNAQWALRGDVRLLFVPTTASDGLTSDSEFFLGFTRRFGGYDAPVDSDGDGVFAPQDLCPDAAEDQDGFEDEDGCPDPDNDGDGVLDADDRCPADAETLNGIDDEDGCPEADGDGDGILGSRDLCPQQAEDFDGFEDDDGCPDVDPGAPPPGASGAPPEEHFEATKRVGPRGAPPEEHFEATKRVDSR